MFLLKQIWDAIWSIIWPWSVYGFLTWKWINAGWHHDFLEKELEKEKRNHESERDRRMNAEHTREYQIRRIRELEVSYQEQFKWHVYRVKELENKIASLKGENKQAAPRTALGALLGLTSRRRQEVNE